MTLLGDTFVPELWYDLNTSAPKGKTEYTIKTRCLIFLMPCSVTRFYFTTNKNLEGETIHGWMILWSSLMTEGPCHPSGEECLNKQSDPQSCCHYVTNVTGDALS